MYGFPVGMIVLIVVTILIYFGLAHRILDRMRLTDKAALLILLGIIVGSFVNIPLSRGQVSVSVNVGGAILPIIIAIYLLTRAGTTKEWVRAIVATIATTIVSYLFTVNFMTEDPWQGRTDFIDPLFVYPLIAGLVAYLVGRSRRSAFIAATLGVLGMDILDYVRLISSNTRGAVNIGGAGAFDSIIISGIVAVLLAEIIGETRERIQGGPQTKGRPKELIRSLEGVHIDQEAKPNPEPALKRNLRLENKDDNLQQGSADNE